MTMSAEPESARSRIRAAVDELRPELIEFAADLVCEPSVQGEEGDAQALVRTRLESLGSR